MKSSKFNNTVLLMMVILVAGLMGIGSPCFAKEMKKVAVLPFTINSQNDLTFLQKGIFDMFSTRLSHADEVDVLTREQLDAVIKSSSRAQQLTKGINEIKAKELATLLNVDHVLFGSVTIFGNSMSLDANMVNIGPDTPTLTFSRQGKEQGTVLTELDNIAEEINFKVFGIQTETFQSPNIADSRYLPETREGYASPLREFETLFAINDIIDGIAVGDVDGDKRPEVVICYGDTIDILAMNQQRKLQSKAKIENSSPLMIVGLDVADINQNGYAEIFVSAVNTMNQTVRSSIYEFNGTTYVENPETFPWYFRVVNQNGVPTLYAQQSSKKGPYTSKRVFSLVGNGNQYTPDMTIRVPDGFSLNGFATGNIFEAEVADRVFTNEHGQLKIFDDAGKVDWSGERGYGGTMLFFPFHVTKTSDEEYQGVYFQPRNLIHDVNADGRQNLIAIHNNNKTNAMFKGFREYNFGLIEILEWNELGLSPTGAPKKIPGQITDINIGNPDLDSKAELLVAFVKQRGGLLGGKSKSMIIAYDLQ